MSVRLRISVLRLRQLSEATKSTLRPDVPLDKLQQGHGVRKVGEPPARVRDLPAGTVVVANLMPVAGGSEVMQTPNQLLVLSRKPEDVCQRARGGEVLAALEVALGLPESSANPRLGRRPVVVAHSRPI